MKKEEAQKFLADKKVYVNGKSKEVQMKLLDCGFVWFGGSREIVLKEIPYFFIYDDMFLCSFSIAPYEKSDFDEISAEEILSIEIDTEFVDCDIVVSGWRIDVNYCDWVAIIDGKYMPHKYDYHARMVVRRSNPCRHNIKYNRCATCQSYTRLATEEEKQILFNALKKDGKRWDAEKKCIEPIQYEFHPFEKVLIRDSEIEKWRCNFFSHKSIDGAYPFFCVECAWKMCIPYKGNEDLAGTTNKKQ